MIIERKKIQNCTIADAKMESFRRDLEEPDT